MHLDGRSRNGSSNEFRNVAESAFAEVVKTVQAKHCDLFLIVGDLFDHNRIQESDVEFVQAQLAQLACPTVLIPGNHDVYDDYSLWHRFDPNELGQNVYSIMDHHGSVIEFEELGVRLWGKAMEEHAPENKPLEGTPNLDGTKWNIGLAHGQVVEHRVLGSSSLITEEEITNCGFDYLALGHVHVWAIYQYGKVLACYPGSPVAAFASSLGGHLALVDFNAETGVHITKHRLSTPQPKAKSEDQAFFLVP